VPQPCFRGWPGAYALPVAQLRVCECYWRVMRTRQALPLLAIQPPMRQVYLLATQGLCKLDDGFVVFCEHALPGERLRARTTAVHTRHAFAVKLATLRASPDAARAPALAACSRKLCALLRGRHCGLASQRKPCLWGPTLGPRLLT